MFRVLPACLALALPVAARAAPGSASGTISAPSDAGEVIVYVEKGPAEAVATVSSEHREVLQRNSQFEPNAVWVRAGESVDFVNRDNIYHNVFSSSSGNSFDLGLYHGGKEKTVLMRSPGEVDVYCNIHPGMHAKVLVIPPGSSVAEVKPDGTYTLPDLAPGQYTLVAWSARAEPVRSRVEVQAGGAARADFTLKRRAPSGPHLNKYSEQYGRYR
jgi:plastocyanin